MFGIPNDDLEVIKVEVQRGERKTLEKGRMENNFRQAGWEAPKATQMLFCESPIPAKQSHLPQTPRLHH